MVFVGVVITELSAHNTNQIKNIFSKDKGPSYTLWNGKLHVLENGVWKRVKKNQMIEMNTNEKLYLKQLIDNSYGH